MSKTFWHSTKRDSWLGPWQCRFPVQKKLNPCFEQPTWCFHHCLIWICSWSSSWQLHAVVASQFRITCLYKYTEHLRRSLLRCKAPNALRAPPAKKRLRQRLLCPCPGPKWGKWPQHCRCTEQCPKLIERHCMLQAMLASNCHTVCSTCFQIHYSSHGKSDRFFYRPIVFSDVVATCKYW